MPVSVCVTTALSVLPNVLSSPRFLLSYVSDSPGLVTITNNNNKQYTNALMCSLAS